MSRYSFEQLNGGMLSIGWDPPLSTFFLQTDADQDEPTVWEGTEYSQHREPHALVALARKHSQDVPRNLIEILENDQLAEPGWQSVDERLASGELNITLIEGDKPPETVSRDTTISRLWARVTTRR